MGVCLSGRAADRQARQRVRLLLRQADESVAAGAGELRARQGSEADVQGGQLQAEPAGLVRHARQRVGVVRRLPRRPRRGLAAGAPGRRLGQRLRALPGGEPLRGRRRRTGTTTSACAWPEFPSARRLSSSLPRRRRSRRWKPRARRRTPPPRPSIAIFSGTSNSSRSPRRATSTSCSWATRSRTAGKVRRPGRRISSRSRPPTSASAATRPSTSSGASPRAANWTASRPRSSC